jgi:hypothetical protein
MNTPQSQEQRKTDFTILFQKVRESERNLPDLMAEVNRVRQESEEIRNLRRVVEQVSHEPPRTLTLA